MLAKKFRITKKKEVENVFKNGQSSFDSITGIKKIENSKDFNRFAIVVSTKVSKKASTRNRVKRQLSEACRLYEKEMLSGNDFFVLALPKIKEKKYHEIERSLIQNLKKLNVVK